MAIRSCRYLTTFFLFFTSLFSTTNSVFFLAVTMDTLDMDYGSTGSDFSQEAISGENYSEKYDAVFLLFRCIYFFAAAVAVVFVGFACCSIDLELGHTLQHR